MNIQQTNLPGVLLLQPKVFEDKRGYFMETWNSRTFADAGINTRWVQDNYSSSVEGVLRGLHYQLIQPQAKLIRITRGRVFDVVVDVRLGSPTFGSWYGVELSADNKRQLYIPRGFAHGFLTLSKTADMHYKCDNYYCPEGERGIIWNDPELAIEWPLTVDQPIISPKDLDATWLSRTPDSDLPRYSGD